MRRCWKKATCTLANPSFRRCVANPASYQTPAFVLAIPETPRKLPDVPGRSGTAEVMDLFVSLLSLAFLLCVCSWVDLQSLPLSTTATSPVSCPEQPLEHDFLDTRPCCQFNESPFVASLHTFHWLCPPREAQLKQKASLND